MRFARASRQSAPFLIYYAVRRGLHISRGYEIAGAAGVWTMARAWDLLAKARFQLGLGGSISIAIVAAWAAFGFVINRAAVRHHLIWLLTALALVVFFAADAASIPYTGYGRFLAYPLLALCGVMFTTAHWLERDRRTLLMAICARHRGTANRSDVAESWHSTSSPTTSAIRSSGQAVSSAIQFARCRAAFLTFKEARRCRGYE